MASTKSTSPLQQSVELLEQALNTGIRGHNREAIEDALQLLRDDGSRGLTDLHYKRAKAGSTITDPDRQGFRLRAGKNKSVWIYRYRSPLDGAQKELQLGTYPELGLADARERWEAAHALRREGKDPAAVVSEQSTVKELCDRFINDYAKKEKRSWREDERQFQHDVIPRFGAVTVPAFTRDVIEGLLDEVYDRGAPRSAEKLLALLHKTFNHSIKRRWREVKGIEANPCAHIELGKRKVQAAFLVEKQIATFAARLPTAAMNQTCREALWLQFLTITRVGEVTGLSWGELDLQAGIWTLPSERSKNLKPHRVMLSRQALALLKSRYVNRTGPFVFPGARTRKPVAATYLARVLAGNRDHLRLPVGFSTHGLRHTALTQLASMGCGKELRDRVANHKDRSVDAIYQHFEHDEAARDWWQQWADRLDRYCEEGSKHG